MSEEKVVGGETYDAYCARVNALPATELDAMIKADQCPYRPEWDCGLPIGMFHCPLCGEMVLACLSHPRQADLSQVPDGPVELDMPDWEGDGSLTINDLKL